MPKTIISVDSISKLRPCQSRLDNYLSHYDARKFTVKQFMGLRNITHQDKLWVAFRMMPKDKAIKAAIDIAKSVLSIYEKRYPGDTRVRECIEAVGLYQKGKITRDELLDKRRAAYAAANAAAYAAANAAAYAAAYAAADAANAANAAADAAAAAAAANAAYAAAYAAYAANAAAAAKTKARAVQEKLQRSIILKYWK